MADDSSDWKFYRYDPSMAAAIIFIILFLSITAIHSYQMVRTRIWIFIPFVIGGFFEWIGYIGRATSSNQTPNWTLGPYIVQTLLLLIAPAFFAASIYMMLGCIILLTDGEHHSLIPQRWLTKVFVAGDVISFLMQGAGGGIMSSGTLSAQKTGENIIMAGLVVQLLFFGFFVVVSAIFHRRIAKQPTAKISEKSLPWERQLYSLYGSSLLILIRSVFRLVEYAQGNDGYLISHEVFLYIFDSVLMFAVMVLMAWIHPSEITARLGEGSGKAMRKMVSVYELA